MSTPSPEKDSLLGPTVHKKIEYQNLKGDVFFAGPFIIQSMESPGMLSCSSLQYLHIHVDSVSKPGLTSRFLIPQFLTGVLKC